MAISILLSNIMKKIIYYNLLVIIILFPIESFSSTGLTAGQEQILASLPPDQRESVISKMVQAEALEADIQSTFEEVKTVTERPEERLMTKEEMEAYNQASKDWIFGYEIFDSSPTTFAPATDIPIPDDYVLGPGDQVRAVLYGTTNSFVEGYIERNGKVLLRGLPPFTLAGLTLQHAEEILTREVSTLYPGTDITLTLGKLKSITIYVLGSAYKSGSYTISSLSTVSNALFVSGGVNTLGSVRNIEVKRNGELIQKFDLYDFLIRGDTSSDIRLQQGDSLFIPLLEKKVLADGAFRRPALYEIKDTDTLEDLIVYAGGIKTEAGSNPQLELNRFDLNKNQRERTKFTLLSSDVLSMNLQDGDMFISKELKKSEKAIVKLKGEFTYPGLYTVNQGETLLQVINRAGGLTDEAYPYGAIFTRKSVAEQQKISFLRSADYLEQVMADTIMGGTFQDLDGDAFQPISEQITRLRTLTPKGRQVVQVNQLALKSNPVLDLIMENGDVLNIPKRPNSVTVAGEVLNPSSLLFIPERRFTDYIQNAGGYKERADVGNAFIILPNGETKKVRNNGLFKTTGGPDIVPGSILVVPVNPEPFNWMFLAKTITPIIADTATAIATVEALLD